MQPTPSELPSATHVAALTVLPLTLLLALTAWAFPHRTAHPTEPPTPNPTVTTIAPSP
ncbi:hypothetical protein [Kitasatospora sp. NPDC093806]|uniref:hypothetical protein n=1 Tax=Kitasatospora sp. NPDC093806 TaxID=3155075 RepID=UPI0034166959